jgi:hypothetical protein
MNMQDELITSVEVDVCFRRDVTTKKFWIQLPLGPIPTDKPFSGEPLFRELGIKVGSSW